MYSTAQKITWKFIPPTAAWWERIVRMLKELLCRVLGKYIVNYEELLTILCYCESIINARPLIYIHEDPNDFVTFVPAMFIHGNNNCETPDLDQVDRSSLASEKDSLSVEKTPESSTDHISDSTTDYVPDSPVESIDNSEEKPPTKTRLGRSIKVPRRLDS
ncbi:DUF5641 domain-containing protein [Trichonephila clavipes]|nr:DUF5641 domain-containing protein [Trichonephila clavipes]